MRGLTPLAAAVERSRFGGKAAGLARLMATGLRVPPGYGLDPEALERLGRDPAPAWRVARKLGLPLALRSSALDEDAGAASFAGQYTTVLGIASRERLGNAAVAVARGGDAAAAYREARGLPEGGTVAAVLQRLVDPVASGVLFTRDPLGGGRRPVVEAAWGLGESVVQGLVEPDRWVLDPDGGVDGRSRSGTRTCGCAPEGRRRCPPAGGGSPV